MSKTQYNVLFWFMVIGAAFLMIAKPIFGLPMDPLALTGYGALTTYVLSQKALWTQTSSARKKAAQELEPEPDDDDDEVSV